MHVAVGRETALRLLRIYGIHAPANAERVDGIEAAIALTGQDVRVRIGAARGSCARPLTREDALALLQECRGSRPPEGAGEDPFVELLMKCSRMFSEFAMNELRVALYLTPRGYRTHAVYMTRTKRLIFPAR